MASSPITSWQIGGGESGNSDIFYFLGLQNHCGDGGKRNLQEDGRDGENESEHRNWQNKWLNIFNHLYINGNDCFVFLRW